MVTYRPDPDATMLRRLEVMVLRGSCRSRACCSQPGARCGRRRGRSSTRGGQRPQPEIADHQQRQRDGLRRGDAAVLGDLHPLGRVRWRRDRCSVVRSAPRGVYETPTAYACGTADGSRPGPGILDLALMSPTASMENRMSRRRVTMPGAVPTVHTSRLLGCLRHCDVRSGRCSRFPAECHGSSRAYSRRTTS